MGHQGLFVQGGYYGLARGELGVLEGRTLARGGSEGAGEGG